MNAKQLFVVVLLATGLSLQASENKKQIMPTSNPGVVRRLATGMVMALAYGASAVSGSTFTANEMVVPPQTCYELTITNPAVTEGGKVIEFGLDHPVCALPSAIHGGSELLWTGTVKTLKKSAGWKVDYQHVNCLASKIADGKGITTYTSKCINADLLGISAEDIKPKSR